MNINIKTKYALDTHVQFQELNINNGQWEKSDGYIVGFKYTIHPYLRKPTVRYAILKEDSYQDYKKSLDKGEEPFERALNWIKEDEIASIIKSSK